MNIHVFFNDGQKILFNQYFAPSLKDDWRVIVHPIRNFDRDQNFGTQAFKNIIHQKIDTLINEIFPLEEHNYSFILSDIDIQFFKPCDTTVRSYLERYDIVFQRENSHTAEVNTGFVAMRMTPDVINFWRRIELELKDALDSSQFVNEQSIANSLLVKTPQLNWGIFPDEIWAWSNHRLFPAHLPGICLHHANCTEPRGNKTSLDLKIEQLDFVNKLVRSRIRHLMFMINNFI
ncbi:MAG: hypothetical protein CVU55_15865 [Deltaproteobacteria bacterium HGW-Deltaproteobacteria-13]|jgi:hypothetical protein|nr:MAG: hypothetical protein CVU55_15865 [Deltaproteobacteria bacterium HGW-Deltaproteobacteria-13]